MTSQKESNTKVTESNPKNEWHLHFSNVCGGTLKWPDYC